MTVNTGLPPVVREFVMRTLDSVGELEGLRLMHAHESEEWDRNRLAAGLYVTAEEAQNILVALERRGVLSNRGDMFRYAPSSDTLRKEVEELVCCSGVRPAFGVWP